MNELIEALMQVLKQGIVVEPYGEDWTSRRGALRIRLADDEDDTTPQTQNTGKGW